MQAVMITHDNILFDATSAASGMPEVCCTATEERILSYVSTCSALPLLLFFWQAKMMS
jgi:hypothetical protein